LSQGPVGNVARFVDVLNRLERKPDICNTSGLAIPVHFDLPRFFEEQIPIFVIQWDAILEGAGYVTNFRV
jgi:hypothetical protein